MQGAWGCRIWALQLKHSTSWSPSLPSVRFGVMLHAAGEPYAAARARCSRVSLPGRLGGQSPTVSGPVCFLSHPCGFLPACAQENVSATPEQPRGPAAIPAGPT